jgi:hypothetical protein
VMQESIAPGLDEITRKRRAVYTALQPFFEQRDLMDVMWLWEEGYASTQERSMRQFINEICQGQKRSKANSAYHNLMTHLQDMHTSLEEDPYTLMLAYRNGKLTFDNKPVSSKMHVLTEAMVVFNKVLENFVSILERDDNYYAYKAREYVAQQVGLHGTELDIHQVNELYIWMKYRENRLEYEYTPRQMSLVLHLLYIGACEFFGPARADQCLAMTIANVEKMPEAKKFPPKLML